MLVSPCKPFLRFLVPLLTLILAALPLPAARAQPPAAAAPLKLQGERFGHAAVVRGDADIYVVGGLGKSGFKETIEHFNVDKNTHEVMETSLLPRLFTTAQVSGDTIYVFGGLALDRSNKNTPIALTTVVEKYDTKTKTVTRLANLPRAVRNAASFLCNGRIYVVGGASGAGEREPRVADVFIYDIAANSWKTGPSLHVARETAVAVYNNRAYAIGGFDGKTPVSLVETLDLSVYNGQWVPLPSTPVPVSANKAAVWGNAVYSFGDYQNGKLVLRYDIARRTWREITVPLAPIRHSAVVVVKNNVVVIGGNSSEHKTGVDTIQVFPIK